MAVLTRAGWGRRRVACRPAITGRPAPTVSIMLPALPYLLALALAALVVVLTGRLRWTRRQYALRLAHATGHPSTMGRRNRVEVADEVALGLAELGLVTDRAGFRVWARGLAGEYAVTVVSAAQVAVVYRSPGAQTELGVFPGVAGALREVAEHAELRTPA